MLKGTSQSIIAKLKRSVWFEIIFTAVGGIALLAYAFSLENGALKWTSVSILVLFAAYSLYYIKKLLLLNSFDPGTENLKVSIEQLTISLTSYLKFYKRSYALLYPLYFCLGLFFALLERGSDEFIRIIAAPEIILYLIALPILFFFASTWLTNWYLKKLYGNLLDKLKELLKDLDSADNN
jgi:hypothetical protein